MLNSGLFFWSQASNPLYLLPYISQFYCCGNQIYLKWKKIKWWNFVTNETCPEHDCFYSLWIKSGDMHAAKCNKL